MKYTVFAIMILFAACQNQVSNTVRKDSLVSDTSMSDTTSKSLTDTTNMVALQDGTNCFLYTKERDTIAMRLSLKNSAASGDLVYNFYEKDRNKGTFKGFLKNDTLLADYTFSSEGMRSVRQVIFLLKGDILLPGNGSMKEQGNRMVFSNKKDISFDNTLVLKLVDCATMSVR